MGYNAERRRIRTPNNTLIADAGDHAALTVSSVQTFARTFLADCAERWKPATRKSYAFNVRRWILPAVGDRRVDAIRAKDVRVPASASTRSTTRPCKASCCASSRTAHGPGCTACGATASRAASLWASPARYRRPPRGRLIGADDLAKLGAALKRLEGEHSLRVVAVRLILRPDAGRARYAACAGARSSLTGSR